MNIESFHSVYTVVLMGLFIGIWIWAWSHKRNMILKRPRDFL